MIKFIALAASFSALFLCQANNFSTEVKVSEAVVYLKGAKVVATANISLKKGKNLVRLENLPRDLNSSTLNFQLPKSVDLLSVKPELQTRNQNVVAKEELRLLEEIKKNNRQIEFYNWQIKVLSNSKAKRNKKSTKKLNRKLGKTNSSSVDKLIKLTDYYANKVVAFDEAVNRLNEKSKMLESQNKLLNEQVSKSRTVYSKNLGLDILLELDSDLDQSFELNMSYLVEQAGWIPTYTLHAQSDKQAVEIKLSSKIYQNTGQDWNEIKLSVSSYRPNLTTQRPILHPMYIREFSHPLTNFQTTSLTNSYQSLMPLSMDTEFTGTLDSNLANEFTWNTVVESPLSVIYEMNRKQAIQSQMDAQHVLLDYREVAAEYVYHAVPFISNEVHLLVKIKNWNELNLMGGEAFLFLDDNYLGKTLINSSYSTNELPISLGTEERIMIRRIRMANQGEKHSKVAEESGVQSFQITYKNNLNFNIKLEILDQLPLSLSNRIVLSDRKYEDAIFAESTGALLWERELSAGESGKINFSFRVTHDKGMSISFSH